MLRLSEPKINLKSFLSTNWLVNLDAWRSNKEKNWFKSNRSSEASLKNSQRHGMTTCSSMKTQLLSRSSDSRVSRKTKSISLDRGSTGLPRSFPGQKSWLNIVPWNRNTFLQRTTMVLPTLSTLLTS